MTWILSALGTSWAKIAAIGAIVFAILAAAAKVFLAGRREGEDKVKADAADQQAKAIAERQKVDATVGNLSGDDARKLLHDRWSRPG